MITTSRVIEVTYNANKLACPHDVGGLHMFQVCTSAEESVMKNECWLWCNLSLPFYQKGCQNICLPKYKPEDIFIFFIRLFALQISTRDVRMPASCWVAWLIIDASTKQVNHSAHYCNIGVKICFSGSSPSIRSAYAHMLLHTHTPQMATAVGDIHQSWHKCHVSCNSCQEPQPCFTDLRAHWQQL